MTVLTNAGILSAVVLACGVALAAESNPMPDRVLGKQNLENTIWVLYEMRDAKGEVVEPFVSTQTHVPAIIPILFREGYLEFSTACRRLLAPYRQNDDVVVVGQLHASLGECNGDGPLAALTSELPGELTASLVPRGSRPATLTLKAASGVTFVLYDNGILVHTDPERARPDPEVMYLQIGPGIQGCRHVGPPSPGRLEDTCVLARRVEQDGEGEWRATGDAYPVTSLIEGFTVPSGSRSVLRVLRYEVINPDIHASGYRDVVDMVIEQDFPDASGERYENPPYHWVP